MLNNAYLKKGPKENIKGVVKQNVEVVTLRKAIS